jgi:DNA adenine methylase
MQARPFLKWCGGKSKLVPELLKLAPASYRIYHEPFIGGGALFFALKPKTAVISDANERLIRTYRAIRDNVFNLVGALHAYEDAYKASCLSQSFYYAVRNTENVDAMSNVDVAAWFIFLNKTCFNGLYRVNASGKFNVPQGKFSSPPTICDSENLFACSEALQNIEIKHAGFYSSYGAVQYDDFWYADPPYVPLSGTSDFTSYTSDGFGLNDQATLRDTAALLKQRGAHVLLSNSSAPLVRDLYAGFEIHEIYARRNINSKGDGRGAVKELLIR